MGNRDGGGTRTKGYLAPLTGIRALAALFVMLMHLNQGFSAVEFGDYAPVLYSGYLGVDLFFVLSGFIISHVYAANFGTFAWRNYGVFLWARFARLYPVHLFAIVVLVAIVAGAGAVGIAPNNPESWRLADLPWHLTLLHAWGTVELAGWNAPSWSISAETLAYLSFPALMVGLRRVRTPVAALALALVVLAAFALIFNAAGWTIHAAWLGPPALVRVMAEFLIGCLFYKAYAGWQARSRAWDWAALAALVSFVLASLYLRDEFLQIGLIAAFVLSVAFADGPVRTLLASRPMVFLGEISYSVYLIHFPFIIVMMRVLERTGANGLSPLPTFLLYLAMAALVCALSAATYLLIERPARNYLRSRVAAPLRTFA